MREIFQQATPFLNAQPKCPDWQAATQADECESEGQRRTRVFISYKRDCAPDEAVAEQLFRAINQKHDVFIDKTMLVGTDWAECIETKLKESDYLITLLSAQSVDSEMVKGEIEMAHHFGKQRGRPAILPVRLAYREPFPYSLSPYLNPLQWTSWECDEDTPRLAKELMLAISGRRLSGSGAPTVASTPVADDHAAMPQPLPAASLELPEGTMDPQSRFYIERERDRIALEAIKRKGVTMPIKAPRQMGKSSLLMKLVEAAKREGKKTVLLDFQLFDQSSLGTPDRFYRQFCAWLTIKLELQNKVEEYWDEFLGNNQRCTRYMELYLLEEVGGQLVLAMDEVERIFDTSFRSDFFSMLRNWHNSRSEAGSVWKKLDLVLVTSTEPYQLIDNLNQSPFNVGEVIELADFTAEEVHRLNELHELPLNEAEERAVMGLLNGHPYLVRRALYLVASRRFNAADLLAQASEERGPFGDHLRYHLFRMHGKEDLVRAMREVIRRRTCPDEHLFFRLRGAGLVREKGKQVMPRCQLYANYFGEHLHV